MTITIITAVHNNASQVAESVESVLAQRFQEFEYIVVDGASSDGTLQVLEQYRHRIDTLISEPDKGIYDALNKGISHASGDYVGFLHSDDMFASEDVLGRIHSYVQKYDVDSVYGDLQYVSNTCPSKVLRYWQAGEFSEERLKQGWMPPHPTFYVRRSVYERYGMFDAALKIAADYELMLRFLGRVRISTAYLRGVLVNMRVGGVSNRGLANLACKMKEDYHALRANGVGGALALAGKNARKIGQLWRRRSSEAAASV